MATKRQIFGLVERDLSRDIYLGKIIGSPHIEFEALTIGDLVSKMQTHAAKLANGESLVLESQFAGIVRL